MTPNAQPSISKTKPAFRRWFRFGIRSLLIVTTVVACLLCWIVIEQRQSEFERKFGDRLQGEVHLSNDEPDYHFVYLGAFDSIELHEKKKPQGWWRDLARHILGERIFEAHLYASPSQEDFAQLARLKNLEKLSLCNIPDRDLTLLTSLKSLKWLFLSQRASRCELTPLARLKNLQWLSLDGPSDKDFTPLMGLTNLKTLQINAASVGDLTPLAGLKNLTLLKIRNTPKVSDLTPIAGLTNLKKLWLDGTSVTDLTPIAGLKDLNVLHLGFVSDLTPLARLKNLNVLYVSGTSSIDEQVHFLQQALPDCTINR